MASVVARALRQRYAEVDVLSAPAHRCILQGNPDIARVLDDSDINGLRYKDYAAAVCTWATLENTLLPFRAGIPSRVGQARRLYSMLFTKRVVVRSELGDRTTHWSQILLDYARALGCDTADAQPRVTLDSTDREAAQRLLESARIEEPFAILHPTRGITRPQRWPSEPFAHLLGAMIERYRMPVFVTGSPEDRPLVDRIFTHARTARHTFADRAAPAINIAGATSLRTFVALAEHARFVVAMDSGPMHLAASTGTPTVGIFALRSDEPDRWAPLGPRTAVVRGTYPCPPSHRKETCPDFACVRTVEAGAVFAAVGRVLGGDKVSPYG